MSPITPPGEGERGHRGAVCSAHPLLPAVSTCVRCGDFLCSTCQSQGESICANCRSRVGGGDLPFDRTTFTIDAGIGYAARRFQEQWLPLLGVGAATIVLPQVLSFALNIALMGLMVALPGNPAALGIASFVLVFPPVLAQLALTLGGFRVAIDVLEGREPSFEAFFGAMKRLGASVGQILVFYLGALAVFVPLCALGFVVHQGFGQDALTLYGVVATVAFIVPAVYVGLGLVYATLELVYDPSAGPIEAIRRSWAIARGKRLDIFLLALVQCAAIVLGMLMCCVGVLPAMGVFFLLQATGFLGLRGGLLAAPPA
jgi:hypothetical protein